MSGLQLFMYVALAIFVIGTVYKMIRIANMPLHIRWDLYPIPHEKGKGHYGGSYFEEVDWWTKPANTTMIGELKEMGKEIVFIQSMYHHNKPLWVFSFPFHFGLYLLVGFVLLLILGGIFELSGVTVAATGTGWLAVLVHHLTILTGVIGSVLVTLGALGLFFSRLGKYELRSASVWTDYFNVLLLAAIGVTTFALWLGPDAGYAQARGFMAALVSFSAPPPLPGLLTAHFVLAGVFVLWLPMTHMTHFVGKYFTYHKVRWEDHPNVHGGKVESAVSEALGYNITWSASHIKGGGTWAEAATATDEKEGSEK